MKLVVGLGNPGKEYEKTRHNMGFMVLDALADDLSLDFSKNDFKGTYARLKHPDLDEDVIFLKPMTFMNLSGDSVSALASYYRIDPLDIIVVYDEMALEPGRIRLRKSGSSGGHKGMEDIIRKLGRSDIKRLRVGIGEPEHNPIDYVLGVPKGEEEKKILEGIDQAKKAIKDALLLGFDHAMNAYNH